MAITLQSFSSLLGKVNDGEFILRGEGDQANLERVNRGRSSFTRAIVYKQVDLTTEAAKADNLRTRQALRDALVGPEGESSQTYIRFVERSLGLDDQNVCCTPLSARVVKDLIAGRDADRAATQGDDALRAQFDQEGYTIINQEGGAPTQEEADLNDLRNDLAGEAKEFDLSDQEDEPKAEVKNEPEVNEAPVEDKTAIEVAHLKDELAKLRVSVREALKKTGLDLVSGIKAKLAKDGGVCIPTEDGDKMVKLGTWEAFLVDRSLALNAEDYFMSEIDDMLALADENASVLLDDFNDVEASDDPKDIRALKSKIEQLKSFEDDTSRLTMAVGEKLEKLVGVVKEAFDQSKTRTVGHDKFAEMMTEAGLSGDNDFVANLSFVFANIETQTQVLESLEKTKADFAEKARLVTNRLNEDPTLEQDLIAAFEKGAAPIRAKVNGDVTKGHFDHPQANSAISDLRKAIAETFKPRIAQANLRYETLNAFLAKTGILTFVDKYPKMLSNQTIEKITDFYTKPTPEIKEMLKQAVDAELDGTAGAKGFDVKFDRAFKAFFKELEAQEIRDGEVELKAREGEFRQLAMEILTPGNENAIKHLTELAIYKRSEAESGRGPMTDIFNAIKEQAVRYGLDMIRAGKPTKEDLGREQGPVRTNFLKAVTDFVYRANLQMCHFDDILADKDFQDSAYKLGKKHFKAIIPLNTAKKAELAMNIESLRKDYCLAGGANEKIDYTDPTLPLDAVHALLKSLANKLNVSFD